MIFLLPLSPSSPPPPPSLLIKIYNKTLKEALHAQSYVGAGIQVCLGQTPSLSFSFSLSFSLPLPSLSGLCRHHIFCHFDQSSALSLMFSPCLIMSSFL